MDCGRPSAPAAGPPAPPLRRPTRIDDRACLAHVLPAGRPRRRPTKLHLDKGSDYARGRRALRRRGITPEDRQARHRVCGRLGRHRYVVEGALAWLAGCRRLQVGDERHADILLGFAHLACALSCLKSLNRVPV
jgi:hypothetical protein